MNHCYARNQAIMILRQEAKDDDSKNALSVGIVPASMLSRYKDLLESFGKDKQTDTDIERATYSSWFDMHPEKVAGKMKYGFYMQPMKVEGTKADIDKMFAFL